MMIANSTVKDNEQRSRYWTTIDDGKLRQLLRRIKKSVRLTVVGFPSALDLLDNSAFDKTYSILNYTLSKFITALN